MSLLSFITAVVAAKLLPANPDVETTKRIEELERENKELQTRLDSALQDVAGWASIAHSWRERYENVGRAANGTAQQLAMLSQSAMQANYQLGAQNLFSADFCNCVPSRAQVWEANAFS
jgi:hypothetical protein